MWSPSFCPPARAFVLAVALIAVTPPAEAGWGMGNPPRSAGPPPPVAEESFECMIWGLLTEVFGPWMPTDAAPLECPP